MPKTREQLEQESHMLYMALSNCREALKLVNATLNLPDKQKQFVESSIREADTVMKKIVVPTDFSADGSEAVE